MKIKPDDQTNEPIYRIRVSTGKAKKTMDPKKILRV